MTLLLPFGPLHGINSTLVKHAAATLVNLDSAELYDFAVALGAPPAEVGDIWKRFIADGYIAARADGRFGPTSLMEELARARFGNPLPRKKAETLLKQAIQNAEAVNAEPATAELYYVTRLAVFGSYLDESKQALGDLDLAWEIEERPGVERFAHHCIMYNRDSVAPTRGRVRPKSSLVRLANLEDVLRLECPYQIVYEFTSPLLDELRAERARRRAEYLSDMKSNPMWSLFGDMFAPQEDAAPPGREQQA